MRSTVLVPAPPVLVLRVRGVRRGPAGGDVEDRPGEPLRDLLGDQRHPQALLADDLAAVGGDLAADQLQQGRLARAVAAHEAEPVPRFELQARRRRAAAAAERDADACRLISATGVPPTRCDDYPSGSMCRFGRYSRAIPELIPARDDRPSVAVSQTWVMSTPK